MLIVAATIFGGQAWSDVSIYENFIISITVAKANFLTKAENFYALQEKLEFIAKNTWVGILCGFSR